MVRFLMKQTLENIPRNLEKVYIHISMTFKRPFQTIFGSFVAEKENVVLPKTKAEVRDDSIPPSSFLDSLALASTTSYL